MEKSRVLFLCTGNSARSQMADAFLRKYASGHFEVYSAGLERKAMNSLTVKVMEEAGFDMSGHRARGIGEYLGKVHFQYLITVCDDAEMNCPTVWPGVNQYIHSLDVTLGEEIFERDGNLVIPLYYWIKQ